MVSEEWKADEPNEEAADKMLQDLEAQSFAEILRKLQESVDDEYFGMFFHDLMAKMHKMTPQFKASVHEIFSKP